MGVLTEDLANYCMRKSDEDTGTPSTRQCRVQFMSAAVALSAATSFETPEILNISDETLDGFYAAEPKLERYRRYCGTSAAGKRVCPHPCRREARSLQGDGQRAGEYLQPACRRRPHLCRRGGRSGAGSSPLSNGTFLSSYEESPDRALRKIRLPEPVLRLWQLRTPWPPCPGLPGEAAQFSPEARRTRVRHGGCLSGCHHVPDLLVLNPH